MCFGTEIINNKKTTKNGKGHTTYIFNKELLEEQNKLYLYRKPPEDLELGEDCFIE